MKPDDIRMMHLAGIGGICALTLVAYGVCVHPTVREYQSEREADTQSIFVREDLLSADREHEELTRTQKNLQSRIEAEFIPDGISSLNAKAEQITSLAERCGLSISRLRPGDAVKGAKLVIVPFGMSGDCEYQSFHAFLALLRIEAPDVAVESFDLSSEGSSVGAFRAKLVWNACNESIIAPIANSADGA